MKLNLARFIVLACIGGCQFLPPIPVSQVPNSVSTPVPTVTPVAEEGMSENLIRDKAQLISLRVYSVNREEWAKNGLILNESGSGVLMAIEPVATQPSVYKYLVLTANHVAKKSREQGKESESYIRTHDGLIHKARRHPQEFEKTDLALLYFYSPYRYEVAGKPKNLLLQKGDKIYVAGFPCDLALTNTPCPAEFNLIVGEVERVLNQPLVDNYSIAYTNKVVEGTSGGPILNAQGEVVGINGRREGGAPSQYKRADGSDSTEDDINWMKTMRWGIPIDFYLKLDIKKLFKEIPPLNQEFVIGYISKSEPQTNTPKQTPSVPPDNTSENKSQPDRGHYLSRLEYNFFGVKLSDLFLVVIVGGGGVLGLILLIWWLKKNKIKDSTQAQTRTQQPRQNEGDQLIVQLYFTKIKLGAKINTITAIFLFPNQNQGVNPFSYSLFPEDSASDRDTPKWAICEHDGFLIFIKTAIPKVQGKLTPKVTSSNDYVFTETNQDFWNLKKISNNQYSSMVIEFVDIISYPQVIHHLTT